MGSDRHIYKLVYCALGISLGLVLSYVESLIPIRLGIPGAKLGLPNLVTLCLLYAAGPVPAFVTGLFRVILSGFLFGNLFSIAYAGAGFLLSFLCMLGTAGSGRLGITGVSVTGGISHNIGQLLMALVLTNRYVLSYLPVLLAAGCAAGVVTGLLGGLVLHRLQKYLHDSYLGKSDTK